MSAHDCQRWTPGCARCDLNLDELDEGQLRESLRLAYTEVAALRERLGTLDALLERTDRAAFQGRALAERERDAWRAEAIELGCEDARMSRTTVELVLEGRVRRRIGGSR